MKLNYQPCTLCDQFSLAPIINNALYYKYSTNQQAAQIKIVDDILDERPIHKVIVFKELEVRDSQEQYMRRQYGRQQYLGKIMMLSQYYKFHKNLPLSFDAPFMKVLTRYYDKMRQQDYKRVKKILKEQNGVEISDPPSSFDSMASQEEKKSKYSNVLEGQGLEQTKQAIGEIDMEQSTILLEMCKKIGIALDKKKLSPPKFPDHSDIRRESRRDIFEQYIKKQRQKPLKKKRGRNNSKEVEGNSQKIIIGQHHIFIKKNNKQKQIVLKMNNQNKLQMGKVDIAFIKNQQFKDDKIAKHSNLLKNLTKNIEPKILQNTGKIPLKESIIKVVRPKRSKTIDQIYKPALDHNLNYPLLKTMNRGSTISLATRQNSKKNLLATASTKDVKIRTSSSNVRLRQRSNSIKKFNNNNSNSNSKQFIFSGGKQSHKALLKQQKGKLQNIQQDKFSSLMKGINRFSSGDSHHTPQLERMLQNKLNILSKKEIKK